MTEAQDCVFSGASAGQRSGRGRGYSSRTCFFILMSHFRVVVFPSLLQVGFSTGQKSGSQSFQDSSPAAASAGF